MSILPPAALADARRVLDGGARRLLADQLNGDPIRATAGSNAHGDDNGADKGAPLVHREEFPVVASRDRDGGSLRSGEGL